MSDQFKWCIRISRNSRISIAASWSQFQLSQKVGSQNSLMVYYKANLERPSFTLTFTTLKNIESPINLLWCMSLEGRQILPTCPKSGRFWAKPACLLAGLAPAGAVVAQVVKRVICKSEGPWFLLSMCQRIVGRLQAATMYPSACECLEMLDKCAWV